MTMSDTFQRCTILATFFLSLFCGSLVCTSLVTNHWIESKPWRDKNPLDSSGRVFFGLLHGKKELNVAFGLRPYDITVSEMIDKNPELMSWGLWCTTLASTSVALLCAGLAAFVAIANAVTTPSLKIFALPGIYLTNISAFIMCIISISTWLTQFYTKLYDNVLPKEDLENYWTSKGATTLGYSFWLVIVAGVCHLINILLIKWSTGRTVKQHENPFSSLEEKSVGAIMLY